MAIQVTSGNPEADTAVNEVKTSDAPPAKETSQPAPSEQALAEPAAASGTVETEEVETEDKQDAEKDPETGVGGDAAGKKKGGFQRRIDKLTAKYADKEREAEYWRQEALKGARPNAEAPKPGAQDKNDPGKPKADDFGTHAEFVEALTDWKTDQKLKERDSKAEKSRIESDQQRIAREYLERSTKFSEKTPDFQDVIEEVDDVPLSPAVRDLFLTSENGPQLAYELAKSRDEFVRVNKLPALAAAREIGKLEARLSRPSSEATPKETKTTKAPNPISPVGGTGGASINKSIYDAASMSQAEYERTRAKQRAAKQAG